jgi:hypothetical protein
MKGANDLAFQTTRKYINAVRKLDMPKALISTKLSEIGSIPARCCAEYLTLKVCAKPRIKSIKPAMIRIIVQIFAAVSFFIIINILLK